MSCPICGKPTERAMRPFCSKRCAEVDLAKWLGGAYAIASDEVEDVPEAADAMADQNDPPLRLS